MEGVIRQRRAEHNHRIEIAWRTANFIGAGSKLPPLENFTIEIDPSASLDKSPLNKTHIAPDAGLDAWFVVLGALNGE